jgi:hypothetical protein
MKHFCLFAVIFLQLFFGTITTAFAQDGSCPPWRPCGPGNSWGGNRLVKQGSHGADFRPACASHDACLASGMYSRRECDRMFYQNMRASCDCSSNPRACERRARRYYVATRLFGGSHR